MGSDLMKGDLVRHESRGLGRVEATYGWGEDQSCDVWFARGGALPAIPRRELVPLAEAEAGAYEMVRLALEEMRGEETALIKLGERWKGGEMVLKPADTVMASKTIPIENFFHKIVMVRDRLRVLEQHLNAHKGLADAEKVELQQYITRIYGSLTTFNVLFRDKKDWFVGQKGDE